MLSVLNVLLKNMKQFKIMKLTFQLQLTFHNKRTNRASIKIPARIATRMIHHGTPECCATVFEGNTVTRTYGHTREQDDYKMGSQLIPGVYSSHSVSGHILDNAAYGWIRCLFDTRSSPFRMEYCFKRHSLEIFSQNLENVGLRFDIVVIFLLTYLLRIFVKERRENCIMNHHFSSSFNSYQYIANLVSSM